LVEVTSPKGSPGVLDSLRADPPARTIRILLYELAVILPLLAWLVWSFPRALAGVTDPHPLLLVEWIIAIAIVDLLPIPTPVGFPFSLSFPLQLSVALIYPAPVAGAVALLGSSDTREFRREIPFTQGVWNRCQIAWSVVIESLLFHQLGSLKSPWFGLGPAVLLCAFVGYGVNAVLVALYLHVRTGQPTLSILREMHVGVFGEFVLSYMGLALFAVIVATAFFRIGPWSIAVFIAPLAFARQMFRRTQSLQEATVELEARQQENAYQALHDALTDLPNRALFQSNLRETIEARSKRDGHELVAVMLMDLDHFKEINDTLGHHFGDLLLKEIGPRLSTVLRDEDLLARLGGDEFGILLPNIPDTETAIGIAERVLEELEKPLSVESLQLDVSGSIGIAIYPQHSRDVEALIRRADVAMYAAKESGGGYEVYSESLDRHSPGRLTLVSQVRPAMENREFVLYYQPKVSVKDGRIAGVEALIRWHHPERGLVEPDEFVPMVERTVLLRPLTLYVIDEALRQAREWSRHGVTLDVSVNLSPRSLLDPQLPNQVAELLTRWDVPATRLTLELTESFLMADSGRSVGVMSLLSEVGITLSIDDFGTGYSSLSHLRRLPIREIKIDRSFVMNMRRDPNDWMIARATVDLGRNLGLRVVAEGVEDAETLARLVEMGCEQAQGYHVCVPLPAEELTGWLEAGSAGVRARRGHPQGRRPHQSVERLRAV
jgi:diguanylate cyclase (GGDEF)-like protein